MRRYTKSKKFATINNKEFNISKIPIISLSTISTNSQFTYIPLNKSIISINHHNKLFHERKFNISEKDILKKTYSIYHSPSFLKILFIKYMIQIFKWQIFQIK